MRIEETQETKKITLPLEMTGKTLHWKVLLKYINEECKVVGGFVLQQKVVNHFVPEGLSLATKKQERAKVLVALEGLERSGYVGKAMGIVEGKTGVCLTLLKYPGRVDTEEE